MPMTVSRTASLCLCSTWSTKLTLFASYYEYLTLVNFPYSKIETSTSVCYHLSTGTSLFFETHPKKSFPGLIFADSQTCDEGFVYKKWKFHKVFLGKVVSFIDYKRFTTYYSSIGVSGAGEYHIH